MDGQSKSRERSWTVAPVELMVVPVFFWFKCPSSSQHISRPKQGPKCKMSRWDAADRRTKGSRELDDISDLTSPVRGKHKTSWSDLLSRLLTLNI